MPVLSARKHAQRNLVRAACQAEWQIEEEKLEAICELLSIRSEGMEYSADEVRVRIGLTPKAAGEEGDDDDYQGPVVKDGVAVLPLHGVLAPRMNLMTQVSGGTSTQQFSQWFRECMASPEVQSIVIDCDSPGGTAQGNEEVANLIRSSRGQGKRITAVANGLMASAAYYIASAADEVVASPSSQVGSIGTFMIHSERSRADQNAGQVYTVIKAGQNKAAGNSTEPLNSSSRAILQEKIDDLNGMFVGAVAKNRKITPAQVEEHFGQGKTMLAPRAMQAGMVDRIATLDQVVGDEKQRAKGKRITPFDVAVISGEAAPGLKTEDLSPKTPNKTTAAAAAQREPEKKSMDPRIKQALVNRGLISATASDAEATIALNAFYAASGKTCDGLSVDQIVAALSPRSDVAHASREAAATAAERARIQDLQVRAELLGIGQVDLQSAINDGLQVEDALMQWTDGLAQKQKPVRVESGEQAADKFAQAAVDVLWHRSGSPSLDNLPADRRQPQATSRDLRRKSLLQIAEMSLQIAGVRTAGLDNDDIASMALRGSGDTLVIRMDGGGDTGGGFGRPSDFPNILSALAGKMLDLPLGYFPTTYRAWAFELPSVPDFKPKTIAAMGEFGEFPRVPDGEDFTQSNVAEEASWIATDAYGDEFSLTPKMVTDDDLGAFEEGIRDKQVAHDMTLNRLCVELLTGNQVAGDGYNLYDSTHHANDIQSGSGGAPSTTQLATMRQLLRAQTGVSKKRKLNLFLKLLLVPIELETTTQQLLSTQVKVVPVTTATGEIFRGDVDYLVEPMLSDASALQYYGFAPKAIVRPIVYTHQTGFEAMKTRLYFNPKNNSRVFQCEGRFAAAIRQWRGSVRNAGQ